MATLAEAMQLAVAHQHGGRLREAEAAYRDILAREPQHVEALNNLGNLLQDVGRLDAAIQCFERALAVRPDAMPLHFNLANALRSGGFHERALASFRQAVLLEPKYAAGHNNLAMVQKDMGDLDGATRSLEAAVRIDPNYAEAFYNLGCIRHDLADLAGAQKHYQRSIEIRPQNPVAHYNLGLAYQAQSDWQQARKHFLEALRIRPRYAQPHVGLGVIQLTVGAQDQASAHFEQALQIDPQCAEAHFNLASMQRDRGQLQAALVGFDNAARLSGTMVDAHLSLASVHLQCKQPDEAAAAALRATELRPDSASAAGLLARARQLQGDLQGAIAAFRKHVELDPSDAAAHSNLIFALNADPAVDAAALAAEHRAWAARHAEPLTAQARPSTVGRKPTKRLRIGYVSPNFRQQTVSFFSLPLLAAHDHGAVEVYCYADSKLTDDVTDRFRQAADYWRSIVGLSDDAVADLVRKDEIDVLVDLTGHIGENRLLVFARKPAPIQVTYLGYQNTTGMKAMDYRLTDAHADPPGTTDAFYSEKLIRLPRSFFCYAPSEPSPAVNELPALATGSVTFGSLNSLMKLTPEMIETWARILTAIEDSRLIVLGYRPGVFETRLHEAMTRSGVDPGRVEIVGWCSQTEYLRLHHRIDVALDSFPMNGHTTVCNALWMGVPSIVLEGKTYASRYGGTALVNLELNDLIAGSTDDYVRIATKLAGDLPRLVDLRGRLRGRLAGSPLMDATGFAHSVEKAYREMWKTWCAQP